MTWKLKEQKPDLDDSHDGRLLGCDSDGTWFETNWLPPGEFYKFVEGEWVVDDSVVYWMECPECPISGKIKKYDDRNYKTRQ